MRSKGRDSRSKWKVEVDTERLFRLEEGLDFLVDLAPHNQGGHLEKIKIREE